MTMICSQCPTWNNDIRKVCFKCGAPLREPTENEKLIAEMQQTLKKEMTPEARKLIELAIESQQTGKMPDLSKL